MRFLSPARQTERVSKNIFRYPPRLLIAFSLPPLVVDVFIHFDCNHSTSVSMECQHIHNPQRYALSNPRVKISSIFMVFHCSSLNSFAAVLVHVSALFQECKKIIDLRKWNVLGGGRWCSIKRHFKLPAVLSLSVLFALRNDSLLFLSTSFGFRGQGSSLLLPLLVDFECRVAGRDRDVN